MDSGCAVKIEHISKGAGKAEERGLLQASARAAFFAGAEGLLQVENRIRECLSSDSKALTEIASYLFDLGGKRVRPLLAVLSAQLFGAASPPPMLIDAAAGIELIHVATLLHDDIIDRSPLRRNHPSAFQKFGTAPTLLTGDFLLVKAFGLCAKLDRFIIEKTEHACVNLTEGELIEGSLTAENPLGFDAYVRVIEKKTASLFALAAAVGAHTAGATPEDVARMEEFGLLAGVTFQMVDDILDVTADEDLLGKPAGTDLRQRTPSLVNIEWLASGVATAREFFAGEPPSEEECRKALLHIRNDVRLLSRCRETAQGVAHKALRTLKSVQNSTVSEHTRSQLMSLVEYTLERCL